jgi:hypothetical protein
VNYNGPTMFAGMMRALNHGKPSPIGTASRSCTQSVVRGRTTGDHPISHRRLSHVVATLVVLAVDDQVTNARLAHFAKRDLYRMLVGRRLGSMKQIGSMKQTNHAVIK